MTTNDTPRAGRREWIGLAVLALACLLYVMDLTVLHLAVPAISEDLQPTSAQLLWIIDIYGFMVAGFLVTMGTLGDRIGRRKLLLIGAAAFGVAVAPRRVLASAEMLIVSRALLGIAGATLAPSTLSLIFSMFQDPRQRGGRDRRLDLRVLGRQRHRAGARRRPARALLVGLGVPARAAGDGAAARPRADRPARVPRSRRRAARPGQRGDVPRRGPGRDLRPQADRPGRASAGCRSPSIARRAGRRRPVRPPPVRARRPDDRPAPVPDPGVQRVAGRSTS